MQFGHFDDKALEYVSNLPQLRELHLTSKGITDGGLTHLEHMSQLEMLSLCETQVTEQGVRTIQKALPNCRIVR